MKVQDDPDFRRAVEGMLASVASDDDDERMERPGPQPMGHAEGKVLLDSYNTNHVFHPGDLVEWKPGFRNTRLPAYDEPMFVFKVLSTPITNPNAEPSSSHFGQQYDLVGAFRDEDGDVILYHFDSRRFMPFRLRVPGADTPISDGMGR